MLRINNDTKNTCSPNTKNRVSNLRCFYRYACTNQYFPYCLVMQILLPLFQLKSIYISEYLCDDDMKSLLDFEVYTMQRLFIHKVNMNFIGKPTKTCLDCYPDLLIKCPLLCNAELLIVIFFSTIPCL